VVGGCSVTEVSDELLAISLYVGLRHEGDGNVSLLFSWSLNMGQWVGHKCLLSWYS